MELDKLPIVELDSLYAANSDLRMMTAAATTASVEKPLTLADIEAAMARLKESFDESLRRCAPVPGEAILASRAAQDLVVPGPNLSALFGLPVHELPDCFAKQTVPNKVHRHRNQNANYHKRIQKKWNARYGTHEEVAYFVDTSLVTLGIQSQPGIFMSSGARGALRCTF